MLRRDHSRKRVPGRALRYERMLARRVSGTLSPQVQETEGVRVICITSHDPIAVAISTRWPLAL